MASLSLRKDEGLGLAIAFALHAGLLVVLVLRPASHEVVKAPSRIEVTISDEVGLTSTSPNPAAQAAPDEAPEQGEPAPPAPQEAAEPEPAPEPDRAEPAKPEPAKPTPRPVAKPVPKPTPPRKPEPAPKPSAKPSPKPAAKPAPKPSPKPAPTRRSSAIDDIVSKPSTRNSSSTSSKATSAPKTNGGTRVGSDFLDGVTGATGQKTTGAPAAQVGPRERSALSASIYRQLKPHWQAPQGVDSELLITQVRFSLNRDGSLSGEPSVVRTTGRTAANAAQVGRHQEQAVRAVKLAAPFNLPEDLYEGWKNVTVNFDRKLSQ